MKTRMMRSVTAFFAAATLSVAVVPAATAAPVVDVPPEVTSALANFPTDPQAAMTAWTTWAATQPMTTRSTVPEQSRIDCRIDSDGVSKCTAYEPNPSGKNWVREGSTYTEANDKTQVFKSKGKWVRNNDGANNNPITNTDRFYSFDYWTPWTTPGVSYDTEVADDGWYTIQSQNPTAGDDQLPVVMVRVSPDGTRAQIWQQYEDGKIAAQQSLTLRNVGKINVPQSTKMR